MKWNQDNMDDKKMDFLLRLALKQQAEPDAVLQQKILHQWKEKKEMNRKKKWMTATAAATAVLAFTVSVGAAGHYLSSSQVAQEFQYEKISDAFSKGKGIEIGKTQSWGNYHVTLMGVASGEALGSVHLDENGQLIDDMTYVVVAIEHADGTPMPDPAVAEPEEIQDFFVSPLIEGYNPINFNAVTMNGGATFDVIDGVEYRIAECDNVEIFADSKLYLCVMDDTFYNPAAYQYDAQSGAITVNPEYEGMNLLFDLPIDSSKADPDKVAEYLKEFDLIYELEQPSMEESSEENEELTQEYIDFMTSGEWEQVLQDAECLIEPTVVERTNHDSYEMDYTIALPDDTSISGTLYFYDALFIDGVAVQKLGTNAGNEEGYYWIYAKGVQNEDGTISVSVYNQFVTEN